MLPLLLAAALAHSGIDAVEHLFGASNVNAILGHGRLTAGVSVEGDLTVLTWPSPFGPDQLGYLTSNDLEARDLPRFGADEGAGVVLGLRVATGQGTDEVTWLRDAATWRVSQDHGPEDGAAVHTRFTSDRLALEVTLVDAVDPATDALARTLEVRRTGPVVEAAWMLVHANLSPLPADSVIPQLPFADWARDGRDDYGALWDPVARAVLHLHPRGERVTTSILHLLGEASVDWGPLGDALAAGTPSPSELAELRVALDGPAHDGVWWAVRTVPPPDQHQVGYDRTPFCDRVDDVIDNLLDLPGVIPGVTLPIEPALLDALRCGDGFAPIDVAEGWSHAATDPWTDLQDGELEGSDVAAGEVSSALRVPLVFDGDLARAAVVFGAGADADAALAAAAADPWQVAPRADAALAAWLGALTVPGVPGSRAHRVARRALADLRVGTDAATGAIVASITRQPPYGLDWPRDGAFFHLLLDAVGDTALVDRRVRLVRDWQVTTPTPPTPLIDPAPPVDPERGDVGTWPAGRWEMNHLPDGTPGGTFRFEIDTTAFAVWALVAHVGWTTQDPDAYLRELWPSIVLGADLLARWRDAATGLQAPAQEDDQASYTQTLHGAVTVFGALDLAARAARRLGERETAERWEARAVELRTAMLTLLVDPETGALVQGASDRAPFQATGRRPTGPQAWAVWPMSVWSPEDPAVDLQLEVDLAVVEPTIDLQTEGGSYFMKTTLAAAMARGQDPRWAERLAGLPERLAALAAPGTDHFGEVLLVRDGRPEQRVANPHLWEGALFALTVLALEDPDALRRYDEVLPPSRVVAAPAAGEAPGRCGCASGSQGGGPALLALLALGRRRGARGPVPMTPRRGGVERPPR